ncbi:hypothetical protein HYT26_02925 [Candidatus Pacearchaeota archaeon]|nr:hypothetical protein [Candidatus Pacearchaeota archaeon]
MDKRQAKKVRKKFNPNNGYYVEFYSRFKDTLSFVCDYGVSGASEHGGKVKVKVYKSLDRYPPAIILPHLEHIAEVGSFYIYDLKQKTILDFLKEVRKGIEKLVSQEKKE